MDDDLKHLIKKIKRALNKINPIEPNMLAKNRALLGYGSIEDKMFASILCEELNKERDFEDTWSVDDGQGVATYLVYDEFPLDKFPIYSCKHSKRKKPYFLICKIDDEKYKISLED